MTAVSQSYPEYLGGLNEQPDERKKPGQLVEALNVIPDPVIGLTRRPGFRKILWKEDGSDLTDQTATGIDPRGTWFEMQRSNQINDDYIYFGCINPDGTVVIFNQDGNLQDVKYVSDSIFPHKNYVYDSGQLNVYDDNGDQIGDPINTQDQKIEDYFRHEVDSPLKWCVSKDHVIVTNPVKVPTLSKGKKPTTEDKNKYYSFINLKVLDTENYNYTFRRFYSDTNVETYREITSIDILDVEDLGDKWDKDLTLPLQNNSPFQVTLDTPSGVTEPAIVEINFIGQIVQLKSNDGDGYRNEARYTYSAEIIDPGKGYKKGQVFTERISGINGNPALTVTLKVKKVQKITGTANDLVVPNVTNDMSAQDILRELGKAFEAVGIDKTVIVGSGLYLENSHPFSVDTTEIAVADVMNSQKNDDDIVPLVRVNTVAELPVECYGGFKVEVINSFNNENNYFLEYQTESQTPEDNNQDDTVLLTKSDGYWEEIAKPFEKFRPNAGTLPHMITVAREPDQTRLVFIVSRIDYENRTAGTAKDNPSMFVDGTPITALSYYKNRLFFLTKGGTIISSRAGEINNLFLNTAVSTSLIDPIDIVANSEQRVPIYGAAVVNNGLVLFGESEQYAMTTNSDLLTSETANVTKIANYTFDESSNPIYLGTNLAFISSGSTRFYEMTNVYDRGPVDINERSQQIQTQFGRGFNMPVSSREQSMAIVYKRYVRHDISSRSREMYLYRFRQENSQESSQTSWVRWSTDKPVAYVSLPRDKMFVVVANTTSSELYLMDSSSLEGLPASSASVVPNFTDGYTDNADGAPFETRITFPTIYPRGKESYDITSNVTIHRVKLSTAAIGAYDLTIDRKGYDTYNILVEQTPSDEFLASSPQGSPYPDKDPEEDFTITIPPLRGEHVETVPIYTRNKNLTLTMSTNYNAPLTLRSMTWEGDWNPPYYKRV